MGALSPGNVAAGWSAPTSRLGRLQLALWLFALVNAMAAERTIEFNRDVRPILSDKCFGCHGPDATVKKIPLRLDKEELAKADLGGRRAVVEGDPDASELIKRITSANQGRRMPPVWSGHTLSAAEIETLRLWIHQGARWQQHWAFLPPRRPALPQVKAASWCRNAIDFFVLGRLQREGLRPSAEADKETLIRRLSYDIIGLPPSPGEVDAFLADASVNAYEKLVDRLLASPHYGERMAIRWLDAARYADTNGYQFDGERIMWRWRDWVIEAFNRNMPYDQFIVEQIAGDMLPNATLDQKIATGFNRNHRANTEDGIIPEEYAVEYVVDRVETTATVFLGLTLGCARCHNHKYDPFTQKDFYRVFAYFNNVPELGRAMKYGNSPPLIPAPTREQQEKLRQIEAQIAAVEADLKRREDQIRKQQRAWEQALKSQTPLYWSPSSMLDAAPLQQTAQGQPAAHSQADGRPQAVRLDGRAPLAFPDAGQFDITDQFSIAAWVNAECERDCSIFSRMADSPTGKGYGLHLRNGKLFVTMTSNWADDAIRFESVEPFPSRSWRHVALTYDGSVAAAGFRLWVDGKPVKVNILLDTLYRPFRNAGNKFIQPFRIGAGNGPEQRFQGQIADVRLYRRVLEAEEIESLAVGQALNELARKAESDRTAAEKRQLRWHFLEHAASAEIRTLWRRLTQLREAKQLHERTFPTTMIMAENRVRKKTHLLIRGQYDKKGEEVEPGLPELFGALPPGLPNNRLGFARWLASADNPLTARVAVNRIWQMLFGTGLVKTAEDFGLQGEWPSHPELLDWLATEFIRSGWNVKQLIKTIVMSAAYRQSSAAPPELIQKDPENRLLARGPRVRLPAEMIRDGALAIAGVLNRRIGGPSVKPYQPEGLWRDLIMQDQEYVQSRGPDLYRRSLYTFWKRTIAPPFMANFDSALRESCTVRTVATNTPLQALNLMNDVTFVEAARLLGQRMMKEGGSLPEQRLRYGFRLVTARRPNAQELEVLMGSLRYHLDYFAGKDNRAQAYLSHGETPPDPGLDARQLAAYAAVASLMLNLDEAITKE